MWSPDRPTSRPPRSTRSSHFRSASSGTPPRQASISTSGIDSKSFNSAFADADDDSSCDDTYVSMSSKKESLFEESPRILKETTRVTNTPSRRSPGLPRKKEFRPHTISRAESSGILDKLKSDINSLDIIRNSSYAEEISTVFSGSVFDFDDENNSITAKSIASTVPSVIERSRSVDRSFRREDMRGPFAVDAIRQRHGSSSLDGREGHSLRGHTSGAASVGSRRDMSRKHNELREKLQKEKQEMQNQSMVGRNKAHSQEQLSEKDEKISKLQETIRGLKREVVMEKDENERSSATLSDLKFQLNECKEKEAETKNALREVMKNVEHERSVREKEMHLASKVQRAEVLMLEERLTELEKDTIAKSDTLKDEIAKKSSVINGLRQDIRQLQSKLDSTSKSKADSDKTLRSQIERLELRLDNETVTHRKKVTELNEMHQSSEEEWAEKLNHMETKIEEQNAREAEWTDELSMTKLELENLRAYSVTLEKQNQYLKNSEDDAQRLERECNELKQQNSQTEQTIDDLRKELEVAQEAKVSLARQLETLKVTEREKDEYIDKMEDSLEELDDDKQGFTVKIEQLQKELCQSQSQFQEMKVTLEEAKKETADAKLQLQDATSKLEKSMDDGRRLAKQATEKESENEKMVKAVSSLETKLKQEVEEHCADMTNHQKHLNKLEVKINEMQREIQTNQKQLAKIPKLDTKIKELTESLAQSEDKHSTLQSKLKNTISKLDESEINYDRLDKKYKALMREQSEFEEREKSHASNATKREREQIETIQKLKKEKNDQTAHIERLQEEVVKAKREVSQAKEETKKCKDQLKTALQSLDEMMKYIDGMKDESDDMIKALESETEGLMKRIGVLEKHREFDQQTIKLYEEEKTERAKQIRDECQQKSQAALQKIKSDHDQEIQDIRSRYECRIKELQSTIAQRSEITKSLQEHGSSEVSNLMKRVGEMTEKHSKDLRNMREKYEAELAEESTAKNALKATLRELESKNEDLNDALKATSVASTKSVPVACNNCGAITKTLEEKEQTCTELKTRLQELTKTESMLRGELAQNKQLMTITQANEKLLEDHVASLEAQIDTLVADYESKLGA